MKKILIFSTAYYPFVGGAEVAVKEITDRVFDFEFDLITAKFNKDIPKFEKIKNVNVYRLGFGFPTIDKLLLPFWGAIFALNLTNKNHYDFYWCIMATFASGAAYVANLLHFWKPVPIALTLQEGDSEEHFKKHWFGLINLSWWLALKNTKILTVLSSYLAKRAKKFGYKGDIKIIPNGVDTKNFDVNVSSIEKLEIRHKLNLNENDLVLITASRLTLKNGIEYVIKSLPKLPVNVKFLILGEGELKEELQKLAKILKVSERVVFKGFVAHTEMPKYLKISDIFIRPSLSEGMGNSFIEAMAAELPVIATQEGGISDFLFDPDLNSDKKPTGLAVKPRDPEGIAKQTLRFIEDTELTKQIVSNAKKMVFEKYDWDLIAKDMREKVFWPLLK